MKYEIFIRVGAKAVPSYVMPCSDLLRLHMNKLVPFFAIGGHRKKNQKKLGYTGLERLETSGHAGVAFCTSSPSRQIFPLGNQQCMDTGYVFRWVL